MSRGKKLISLMIGILVVVAAVQAQDFVITRTHDVSGLTSTYTGIEPVDLSTWPDTQVRAAVVADCRYASGVSIRARFIKTGITLMSTGWISGGNYGFDDINSTTSDIHGGYFVYDMTPITDPPSGRVRFIFRCSR